MRRDKPAHKLPLSQKITVWALTDTERQHSAVSQNTKRSDLHRQNPRMLPTIGQRRSPDAKNLFTMSKNQSRQPIGLQPAAAEPGNGKTIKSFIPETTAPGRPPNAQAGGADRNRTDDLLRAKQALSQLSYGPLPEVRRQKTEDRRACFTLSRSSDLCPLTLVGLGRFELPTSRLSGVRSNQLSYRPLSEDRDQKTDDRADPVGRSNPRPKARHTLSVLCHLSSDL